MPQYKEIRDTRVILYFSISCLRRFRQIVVWKFSGSYSWYKDLSMILIHFMAIGFLSKCMKTWILTPYIVMLSFQLILAFLICISVTICTVIFNKRLHFNKTGWTTHWKPKCCLFQFKISFKFLFLIYINLTVFF